MDRDERRGGNNEEYRAPVLRIGVRDAKANLSKVLRDVKRGREVVITEYGKPIGRIVPVRSLSLEERVAEMENRGELGPARPLAKPILPLIIPADVAQKYLQEEREK